MTLLVSRFKQSLPGARRAELERLQAEIGRLQAVADQAQAQAVATQAALDQTTSRLGELKTSIQAIIQASQDYHLTPLNIRNRLRSALAADAKPSIANLPGL